jgi:rhamnose utilization protein RhaD (predicted bifunctional aldolase and dehydrogenase)
MDTIISSLVEEKRRTLLQLSHNLGDESRRLAILGEGSTLATLDEEGVVLCESTALLDLMDRTDVSDVEVEDQLLGCRVDPQSRKPSVEALFHAYLLSLPNVAYVGHTHPITVNQILCSPLAETFARNRLFPDEIVCCGPASVLVPYTDPGLHLARAIREQTERFIREYERQPRVILLENHGVITLGSSPQSVLAAMLMAAKAAEIFVGAKALGGPRFLTQENIHRIDNRIDEHYRQRALNL